MRRAKLSIGLAVVLAIFAAGAFMTGTRAAGQTVTVLHKFSNNGTDGTNPVAGLIFDASGNLYGTTKDGGSGQCTNLINPSYVVGCGTVFELSPKAGGGWSERVLHTFDRGKDGLAPMAGLIFDALGNLYGTTARGGINDDGVVFKLVHKTGGGWTEEALHRFSGPDGSYPGAGLIFDAAGNLYGTTVGGGAYGSGTVFELSPSAGGGWSEKVLHSFGQITDGSYPLAALIFDAAGNLYGTTFEGGAYGYGTVFELSPHAGGGWTEKVLHSFNNNGTDGFWPFAGLIFDAVGNLYGTTWAIGGTVFELTPTASGSWDETVLLSFNGTAGDSPVAGLIFDAAGNLYGTTVSGASIGGIGGTAFELTPTGSGIWTQTVLNSFRDGSQVSAGLIFDAEGNLYGTTAGNNAADSFTPNFGAVFEIKP